MAPNVLSLAIFVFVFYLFRYLFRALKSGRHSNVNRLPYPTTSHWLWGHEKEAFDRPCGEAYSQWLDRFGEVVRIKGALFYGDIVLVSDPYVLNHILAKHVYDYVKSPVFRPLIDRLLGKSMVWAEGDDHRRMKSVLGPSFSADNVKNMEEAVIESANTLANTLRAHITSVLADGKGEKTAIVNALEWSSRATLDIIGRVGFGHDFKCGTSSDAQKIFQLWRDQVGLGLTSTGFIAPHVLRAFPFITSLPFGAIQAQGAIKLRIRALAKHLAEEKLNTLATTGKVDEDGKDLLTYLVKASKTENHAVSVDELLDHITTFVMVGHETTAGVINYTMQALGSHLDVQDKLRAELEEFGREPTYEDFLDPKALPYLDAVTKEAMRLYPPSAHTERVALRNDVIRLKTPIKTRDGTEMTSLRIKKGQLLYIPSLSVNTHSSTWGPDGQSFRPSRWLSDVSSLPKATLSGWNNLMTFSEGPRLCLGYRLAVFEYKAILSALVRAVRFENAGYHIESKFSATLQPYIVGSSTEPVDERMKGAWMPVRVGLVGDE